MRRYLDAEWTKVRTAPGLGWLLFAVIAVTVAVSAAASAAVSPPLRCPRVGCDYDVVKVSLAGVQVGQAIVAVLAVLAISDEYGTGMIRTTFTAMPIRIGVLAAKAVVVTGVTLLSGAFAVLGSVLAGRLLLAGHGFTPAHGYPLVSLTDGPTLRAATGSIFYLALIALLSLGIAVAVRGAAASIGVVLWVLYVMSILPAIINNARWARFLWRISPMDAGLAVQATTNLPALPLSPWAGLGVLLAWATSALLCGGLLLRLRAA